MPTANENRVLSFLKGLTCSASPCHASGTVTGRGGAYQRKGGAEGECGEDRYLGCFIQPSRRTCPLASFTCRAGELALSRHRASEKWVAYSAGRPQVAGRHGEHLGWHSVWHSAETGKRGGLRSDSVSKWPQREIHFGFLSCVINVC